MSIIFQHECHDECDTVRSLVTLTSSILESGSCDALSENAANNFFRLLRSFESHGFMGMGDEKSAIYRIKLAFENTFRCYLFSSTEIINKLADIYRRAIYKKVDISSDDIIFANLFFRCLLDNLSARI